MPVGKGHIPVEYISLSQLKGLTQNKYFIILVVWNGQKTASEMNAWLNGNSDKDIHISTGLALKSEHVRQTFHIYGTDLHQDLDLSE